MREAICSWVSIYEVILTPGSFMFSVLQECQFQSKGRARKRGARFIMLVEEDDVQQCNEDLRDFNEIERVGGFVSCSLLSLSFVLSLCLFLLCSAHFLSLSNL